MVSEGGAVRMQIFQEVSSVSQRLTEGIITNKRSIESTVLIDDQQIVVLGGLIQDDEGVGQSKVPGLGDIPLVGALFRYETRERRKTNLFVFLRPVVIRNADDSRLITQGRYETIRASQSSRPSYDSALLPELGLPRLPEGLQTLPGEMLSPNLPRSAK
jgi:general secretion pathway protein D